MVNIVNIDLPALRLREDDVYLLQSFSFKIFKNSKNFDESGINAIKNYD